MLFVGEGYHSAKVQSVYSTASDDLAREIMIFKLHLPKLNRKYLFWRSKFALLNWVMKFSNLSNFLNIPGGYTIENLIKNLLEDFFSKWKTEGLQRFESRSQEKWLKPDSVATNEYSWYSSSERPDIKSHVSLSLSLYIYIYIYTYK